MFRKLLSYFYPVTRKITTVHNGTLELTWFNGRKMLNSAHANYSYDSLQRILHSGLSKIELKNIRSILVLGLGGGSVIQTLRGDFNYHEKITAVEFDKSVIDIAEKEFNVSSNDQLHIVHANAFDFVKLTIEKFDLIIIDLFIDTTVPEQAYEFEFWNHIYKILSTKGSFLFNSSMNKKENYQLNRLTDFLSVNFSIQRFEVESINVLLIGRKLN